MNSSAGCVLASVVALLALGLGMDNVARSEAHFSATPHRSFIVCARTEEHRRPIQNVTVGDSTAGVTEVSFRRARNQRWCTDPVWVGTDGGSSGHRALVSVFGHGLSEVTIRYASPHADGHPSVFESAFMLDCASNYYHMVVDLPPTEPGVPLVSVGFVTHAERVLSP